jgi:hypothetical protein
LAVLGFVSGSYTSVSRGADEVAFVLSLGVKLQSESKTTPIIALFSLSKILQLRFTPAYIADIYTSMVKDENKFLDLRQLLCLHALIETGESRSPPPRLIPQMMINPARSKHTLAKNRWP